MQHLDNQEKRDYMKASEIVPGLVKDESKVIDFLRAEDYDPLKAAKRLALYWQSRKEIFGDRWLLPMTQTGTGAMSMRDVDILRTGYMVLFPNAPNGPFAIVDHARLPKGVPTTCQMISSFYYITVFVNEAFQSPGLTILFVVRSGDRPTHTLRPELFAKGLKCLPLKLHRVVVAQAYEEGKQHLLEYLGYQEQQYVSHNLSHSAQLVAANSARRTLDLMKAHGFERQSLPRYFGGDYDFDSFATWTRARISIEDIMSGAPLLRNELIAFRGVEVVGRLDKEASPEERAEGIRKRNRIYQRRTYHRGKLKTQALEEERNVWEARNAALREEGTRLEDLLKKAQRIVSNLP